ncbi:24_t:CDS:1, partial [Dentiscutata heterogama]
SQEHKSINFIPPEIDPEVFDPQFNFKDNSNDWIILCVMKYQQRFNIPNMGIEALTKFICSLLKYFKIS